MRYHKEDLMSAPTVQINKERTQRENTNMKVKRRILPFLFVALLVFSQTGSIASAVVGESTAASATSENAVQTGQDQETPDAEKTQGTSNVGDVDSGEGVPEKDPEDTEGAIDAERAEEAESSNADDDAETAEGAEVENAEGTEGELSLLSIDTAASMDGIYTIVASVSTDKTLNISGGSADNGATLQTYVSDRTPKQRFQIKPVKNDPGYYTIINVQSGKALDVPLAQVKSGLTIQQYTPNGTNAQKWAFASTGASDGSYYIVSKLNSKFCLDVAGASKANGTRVQLYTANKTVAQRFLLKQQVSTISNGLYSLKSSVSTQFVLDVAGGSSANGANVQIYQSNNTFAQKFNVVFDANTGYYTITNVMSGKALDVAGAGTWSGANVNMYQANKTRAQMWAIESDGKGGYVLYSACSGLALDVANASARNGTNVQTYKPNKTAAQSWTFSAARMLDNGVYLVKSALGTALDAAGNATAVGTNIQAYTLNATLAQRFKLTYKDSGYYTLECLNSGLLVGAVASSGNVQLTNTAVDDSKLWQPLAAGDGYVVFKNKTGKVMGVQNGSTAAGANVWVSQANSATAQKWNFVATSPLPEGYFTIISASSSKLVVDIPNASRDNGARPQLYSSNETLAQRFGVKSAGNDSYTITAVCSNKVLDVSNASIDASGNGILQQYVSNGTNAQKWYIEYVGGGQFVVASILNKNSCITVKGDAAVSAPLVISTRKDSTAQRFIFKPISSTVPIRYGITLDQMAAYQKQGNPYIADVTLATIRSALNPNGSSLYQFADLRSYTGMTATQINNFLKSTASGRAGVLKDYGASFVNASKQYGVNECYLVSHAILESGWGTSTLAKGYYYDGKTEINGKRYPAGTYYNLFGIGAVDSSPLSGGRSMAIQNGWNSVDKAILGGTAWIAKYYIYASSYPQPTLYDMKWDVARSNATHAYGWHQYATDYLWPKKNSDLISECYAQSGFTPNLVYLIPSYA
jgi:beta-N-acetylglucosaminidase